MDVKRKSLGTVSEPQNDDRILFDETDNMIEDNIYSNEFDTIYDKKIFVTFVEHLFYQQNSIFIYFNSESI